MSSKRRTLGAGTPAVPAPRRQQPTPDQLQAAADDLRALLAEARGALGDLVRERKAVEELARSQAQKVIVTHVDKCLTELENHIQSTVDILDTRLRGTFDTMLKDYLGESPRMRKLRPGVPAFTEVIQAAGVLKRYTEARNTERDAGTGNG